MKTSAARDASASVRGRAGVAQWGAAAAAALLALLLAAAPASAARRPVVEPWIEATLAEVQARKTTPPRAARALAYVSVAARDAAERATRRRLPV
ncbi:MAG TPA: hypothetical protein VG318_16895, partial [Actinomycetota bacterium]|nr:hypothetical protein [Actinomycetota bacterium]